MFKVTDHCSCRITGLPFLGQGIMGKWDKLSMTPLGRLTKEDDDNNLTYTVCPRRCDPFYIVGYYTKWVTTSWTDGIFKIKMIKTVMMFG